MIGVTHHLNQYRDLQFECFAWYAGTEPRKRSAEMIGLVHGRGLRAYRSSRDPKKGVINYAKAVRFRADRRRPGLFP